MLSPSCRRRRKLPLVVVPRGGEETEQTDRERGGGRIKLMSSNAIVTLWRGKKSKRGGWKSIFLPQSSFLGRRRKRRAAASDAVITPPAFFRGTNYPVTSPFFSGKSGDGTRTYSTLDFRLRFSPLRRVCMQSGHFRLRRLSSFLERERGEKRH